MSEIYKIKHKTTGLFICRSTWSNRHSNLSSRGNVYENNNAWTSWNKCKSLRVFKNNKLYTSLASQFPENICLDSYGAPVCVTFPIEPGDLEKVVYVPK